MKKLIKGINKAIETDSAKEERKDKIITNIICFFLLFSKCKLILLKSFIGEI